MGIVNASIIVLNLAVFGLESALGERLLSRFALWPIGHFYVPELASHVGFEPWQLVTSAFLHASVAHIFLNMFALYMFGGEVERALGSPRYAALYFAAVLSAGAVQLAVVSSSSGAGPYPTVGASGGVFGVLLAFGMIFPRRIVTLIFPPIPMPAWLFVTIYGLIELANGVFGTVEGVAHFAHLGGMLGAIIVLLASRRRAAPPLGP